MKKQSCTLLLLLIFATVQSQNLKEEKKERARITASKIKSVTQTAYTYAFDLKTKTRKPEVKGVKVGAMVYDTKGNLIEEINYNKFGNQESKSAYRYNGDHQIETSVYGPDGKLLSKMKTEYRGDTILGFKYYNADGSLSGTSYAENEYENTADGIRIHKIFIYFSKDSSLAGSQKLVFNKAGELIDFSEYENRYLKFRDVYTYDKSGNQIEHKFYDKNNELTGSHKFKYNASGFLIEIQNCGAYGLPYSTTVYKNDAKGNFIEAIVYADNDINKAQTIYKYTYQYH